jgi:hypothetical protein
MSHNGESFQRPQTKVCAAIDDAKRARHEADRLAIIAWNVKLWAGGTSRPSPTLERARTHGYERLRFRCAACKMSGSVDVPALTYPPDTQLWTPERSLRCGNCGNDGRARCQLLELSGGPDGR